MTMHHKSVAQRVTDVLSAKYLIMKNGVTQATTWLFVLHRVFYYWNCSRRKQKAQMKQSGSRTLSHTFDSAIAQTTYGVNFVRVVIRREGPDCQSVLGSRRQLVSRACMQQMNKWARLMLFISVQLELNNQQTRIFLYLILLFFYRITLLKVWLPRICNQQLTSIVYADLQYWFQFLHKLNLLMWHGFGYRVTLPSIDEYNLVK